ncbi:MAG: hypothetical protein PUB98_10170 [Clostridiales bacterium]|nr:hypothetical protein [Clostridiales bacterium]
MSETYEHYITKNIKSFYKRRLFAPILYLLLLFLLWHLFSLSALLSPAPIDASMSLETAYRNDIEYVQTTLEDLNFTGYTRSFFGFNTGYYYYTIRNEECILVLLSPATSEEGLPMIEETSFSGKIILGTGTGFDTLLANLSQDLDWTENGIRNQVSHYIISEPDYNPIGNAVLLTVYIATGGYALICLILFILFLFFPVLSPPCQKLALFGNPKKLLALAEEELETLPQLATEDMFITEHFFIETSIYGNAIVPIDEIIWIYKHSTLHKFFWYHFSISYTLHISANRHFYIRCPKNIKSDIDGIIDYLAEANHNILVGFNEENRLKVQEKQGTPMHVKKFIDFLNTRV